ATVGGTTIAAGTVTTATKILTMTTFQKAVLAVIIAAAITAGIYEGREAYRSRQQVHALQQNQLPLTEQVRQLTRERDEATAKVAALQQENAGLQAGQKQAEVLKLRGQVGALRQSLASVPTNTTPSTGMARLMNDPAMKEYVHEVQLHTIKQRYDPLFQE